LNSTEAREIRRFGALALVFFGSLCVLGAWRGNPLPTCLFGFLGLFGLSCLVLPSHARPVYAAWLKAARFLGRIVTVLVLTGAYVFVMLPSALLKRVFGGRPLPVRPDRNAASYWVDRTEPAQPRERFPKRY